MNREKARHSESAELESVILSTLAAEQGELSLPELLDRLNGHGQQDRETAIREAISRLTAQGKIEMTSQRKLQISPQARWYT